METSVEGGSRVCWPKKYTHAVGLVWPFFCDIFDGNRAVFRIHVTVCTEVVVVECGIDAVFSFLLFLCL